MLAFFAAIAVVGWFGLSGIQVGEEEDVGERAIIFAGGSPKLAVVEETPEVTDTSEDEEYEIGTFGEPVDDFYADDSEGGWGDTARDLLRGSSEGGRGRGSQRN